MYMAIIADPQYNEKDTVISSEGKPKRYREALNLLELTMLRLRSVCAERLEKSITPSYVLQLGDLIDGLDDQQQMEEDLDKVLACISETFDHPRVPVLHCVGNHCVRVGRNVLHRKLNIGQDLHTRSFYSVDEDRWRIVVLDACDIALDSASRIPENSKLAIEYMEKGLKENDESIVRWGGAISAEQMQWLRGELEEASRRKLNVCVACHMPTLLEAADNTHTLWNRDELNQVLEENNCVKIFLAGHYHVGGYAKSRQGVHHITMPGILEADDNEARAAIMEFSDTFVHVHALSESVPIEGRLELR